MSAIDFLTQPALTRLALSLLHFVWQGALIAVVTAVVLPLMAGRPARERYAVSLAAMLVMAMCVPVTWMCIGGTSTPRVATVERPTAAIPAPVLSAPADNIELAPQASPPTADSASVDRVAMEADTLGITSDPHLAASHANASTLGRSLIQSLQPYLLGGWLVGVVLLSLRLLISCAAVRRLYRQRTPLPDSFSDTLTRLTRFYGRLVRRRIFVSHTVGEALVVGLLRPIVLLPASWITQLPPDMLEAVLAHELAHIRRHDLWVDLFQRMLETLLFYHPAVWWISRRVRFERELCCDELAVRATGDSLGYATALESAARLRLAQRGPTLSAAWRGDRPMKLLYRVRNVLGTTTPSRGRWWPAIVVLASMPLGLWYLAGESWADRNDTDDTTVKIDNEGERGERELDKKWEYVEELREEAVRHLREAEELKESNRLEAAGRHKDIAVRLMGEAALIEIYLRKMDDEQRDEEDYQYDGENEELAKKWEYLEELRKEAIEHLIRAHELAENGREEAAGRHKEHAQQLLGEAGVIEIYFRRHAEGERDEERDNPDVVRDRERGEEDHREHAELRREVEGRQRELARELEQHEQRVREEIERVRRDAERELADTQREVDQRQRDLAGGLEVKQREYNGELQHAREIAEREMGRLRERLQRHQLHLEEQLEQRAQDHQAELEWARNTATRELGELLERLGEDHPEIQSQRAEIRQLERRATHLAQRTRVAAERELAELQREAERHQREVAEELEDREHEVHRELQRARETAEREMGRLREHLQRHHRQHQVEVEQRVQGLQSELERARDAASRNIETLVERLAENHPRARAERENARNEERDAESDALRALKRQMELLMQEVDALRQENQRLRRE